MNIDCFAERVLLTTVCEQKFLHWEYRSQQMDIYLKVIAVSLWRDVHLRSAELFADLVQHLVLSSAQEGATCVREATQGRVSQIFDRGSFIIDRLWLWKLQRHLTSVDVLSVKMEFQARIETSSIASVAAMLTVVKSTLTCAQHLQLTPYCKISTINVSLDLLLRICCFDILLFRIRFWRLFYLGTSKLTNSSVTLEALLHVKRGPTANR